MVKYKLIKKYPGSPELGYVVIKETLNWSQLKDYPEFWELVIEKDYEILEVKGKYGAISSYIEKLDNDLKDKTIFKIKRLSDGEIFTIGDKCSPIGKYRDNIHSITKIWFCNPGYLRLSSNNYTLDIKDIQKVKQPLFTTEDGVDIFDGDKFYYVKFVQYNNTLGKPFEIVKGNHPTFKYEPQYEKYFSTKEKAEEFILMNKPLLSLSDVWDNLKVKDQKEVLKFVKSKLK